MSVLHSYIDYILSTILNYIEVKDSSRQDDLYQTFLCLLLPPTVLILATAQQRPPVFRSEEGVRRPPARWPGAAAAAAAPRGWAGSGPPPRPRCSAAAAPPTPGPRTPRTRGTRACEDDLGRPAPGHQPPSQRPARGTFGFRISENSHQTENETLHVSESQCHRILSPSHVLNIRASNCDEMDIILSKD